MLLGTSMLLLSTQGTESRLCLLLPSGRMQLICSGTSPALLLSSLLQRLLCILCNQPPGRFPFRHCSQPVTSAHVGGTVPDAFTSAFQAPCQSTKHLILFFFFILCIGPTTMQKDLLNGEKSEDVWKVSVTCLWASFCFLFLTMEKNPPVNTS